jgi:hypothetical protein
MSEENKIESTEAVQGKVETAQNTRRAFVKTAAQVAVTAPAVGLLLSATTKPASAVTAYFAGQAHILDDYTFGNEHEDVDALNQATNFSNYNQTSMQDDTYVAPK